MSDLAPIDIATTTDKERAPRYAWVILAIVYLASLTAPLGQFKITAISSYIIEAYSLNYASFGVLMTCLSVIGALLAFPASFICRRFGLRWTASCAMACVALGGIIEVCTSSVTLLYAGRFIEGVGLGLISVAGPTIISLWFPGKTHGLALGVWCTWICMAITIDFNVAPLLAELFGWQSTFWAIIAFAIICLALFLALYRDPATESVDYDTENTFKDCFKYLKNKYIWILCVCFLVYNFVQGAIVNTYYPMFLAETGYSIAESGFMTSVITIIGFIVNPLAGAVAARLHINRKFLVITAFAILYILCFLIGYPSGGNVALCCWSFVIMMGFAAAIGGGGSRPLVPSIMPKRAMAVTLGMSVMTFGMACGQMLAPVYGFCLDSGLTWNEAAWVTAIPLSALTLVLSFFIRPDRKN